MNANKISMVWSVAVCKQLFVEAMPLHMRFSFRHTLIINLIVLCNQISAQDIDFKNIDKTLTEGSHCQFNINGSTGICVNELACPAAANEFRTRNTTPTVCSFSHNQPIVCCLKTKISPTTEIQQRKSANCKNKSNISLDLFGCWLIQLAAF